MPTNIRRSIGLAAVALLLAATAQAQGKSQGKGKGHDKQRGGDEILRGGRRDDGTLRADRRDIYGNGVKVPPGLAKKPGQMPPGQFKKRYGTSEGADVLGGIFRRHGYSVTRIVPAGDSRYVFYRLRDGSERRAIVAPGTERLSFRNVPSSLLQEVLAALY